MSKHVPLSNERNGLKFATSYLPFSSDPMDYDFYVHHQAFTSVFGTLVSTNLKGKIKPILAKSWQHSSDFKIWTFEINDQLTYSNGDKIKGEDIVLSLKRVAFLKKKANSLSGLVEYLEEIEKLSGIENDISGIALKDKNLLLKFTKPMPNLLSLISFGFYSLAHPSLFDHKTGQWLNKKKAISSSAYEVTEWNEDKFVLKLRKGLKNFDYAKAILDVEFQKNDRLKSSADLKDVDLLLDDKNSLLVNSDFQYVGSSEGLKIGYVHCFSWNKQESPFSKIEVRKLLRDRFYKSLQSNGVTLTNSFFPPSLTGVLSVKSEDYKPIEVAPRMEIVTHTMGPSLKIEENKEKKSISEIFNDALISLADKNNIKVNQVDISDESEIDKLDLVINGTGIEADNYIDTVKFMFLSKEGIRLPDSNGRITEELKKEKPDVNLINSELWNQAIIWPIRHYTNGFWFNKKSGLNFEYVNMDTPSIDFQFYKWL